MIVTKDKCCICYSKKVKEKFERAGYIYFKCQRCGLFFCFPTPEKHLIERKFLNGKLYYAINGVRGENEEGLVSDYLKNRPKVERLADEHLNIIEKILDKKGNLLEIGAATGFFLNVARKRGWEVQGVDLNAWASSYAKKEFKIDIFTGSIREAGFKNDSFDVIYMAGVFDHLYKPDEVLEESRRILKKNGLLCILMRNAGGIEVPINEKTYLNWFNPLDYPFVYSAKSCYFFLKTFGFILDKIYFYEYLPYIKGFIKRFFVKFGIVPLYNVIIEKTCLFISTALKLEGTGMLLIAKKINMADRG